MHELPQVQQASIELRYSEDEVSQISMRPLLSTMIHVALLSDHWILKHYSATGRIHQAAPAE